MSQETSQEPISKKRVVYQLPGMEVVTVRRDVEYSTTAAGPQTMDVYYPPKTGDGARLPAVVFVSGYPDAGMQKMLGCKLKEMGSYISWAQLAAVSGFAAITYTTEEPALDVLAVLQFVRQNAADLRVDETRIGVWACSGNVPNALSVLMQEGDEQAKCAVLCYGLMLDLDGSTNVAQAAKMFGFANPCEGKSVEDLPKALPLFLARAGQDNPQLNETIDRFLAKAVNGNLPVTFVNLPTAPHAFDIMLDSEESRAAIKQILAFLQFHLSA